MAPPVEGMQHAGKSPTGTPNEAWLSIDLLQVLCYLFVEPAHQPVVRLMLQNALNECPEVRCWIGLHHAYVHGPAAASDLPLQGAVVGPHTAQPQSEMPYAHALMVVFRLPNLLAPMSPLVC
eukprot:scaffold103550_cov20-Tisochrysis_lutea.AAC.1